MAWTGTNHANPAVLELNGWGMAFGGLRAIDEGGTPRFQEMRYAQRCVCKQLKVPERNFI
jgi:hypothetical protein